MDIKGGIVIYCTEMREGRSRLLAMTPVEFLRRWGLLMPPPNKNLIHYYGALGPRSPLRPLLTAKASTATTRARLKAKVDPIVESAGKQARSWAPCLARVFEVTPLIYPNCRKELVPRGCDNDDRELVRLLKYLADGISKNPARAQKP